MNISVKICGLSTPDSVDAAVAGGAQYVGFVFYPPSPRAVSVSQAKDLSLRLPDSISPVGVMVDPGDDEIDAIRAAVPNIMLQLHGKESPERVRQIRNRFGEGIIKAIAVETAEDVNGAAVYEDAADFLMFDTKAPKTAPGALPGGNGLSFDWKLMAHRAVQKPWFLSGGLSPDNLREAVRSSHAMAVDVSSGVEDKPGVKNLGLIHSFLETASQIKN